MAREAPPAPNRSAIVAGGDIRAGGDIVTGDKITVVTHELAHDVAGLSNPFLGLRSFSYAERASLAGRDKVIAEARAKLTLPGVPHVVLFITGQSGSGKSSFARAGLIPALETYYTQYRRSFAHAVFCPGAHPVAALRDACQRLKSLGAPTVGALVIDQFEEVFTQSPMNERRVFFRWLSRRPAFSQMPLHLLVTMRSDYLGELFKHAELWALKEGGIDLRAMQADELREAILRPVQARYPNGEKTLEPALVDRLVHDAAGQAAYLPLLQVTLEDLWKRGSLKLGAYGNLTDAIRQRAETVYAYTDFDAASPRLARSETDQNTMLELCLSLVAVSLDDDHNLAFGVRRPLTDLPTAQQSLARDLAQARLLNIEQTADAENVSLIHETLIGNWARLGEAVALQREQLQRRGRFKHHLQLWQANGQSQDYLLTGIQLAEAHALRQAGDVELRAEAAVTLLIRSRALAEREHQRQLGGWRAVAILLGLIVATVIGWFGYREYLRLNARSAGAPQAIAGSGLLVESQEVTVERYRQCVDAERCSAPPRFLQDAESTYYRDDALRLPVTGVDSLQAADFCHWIGRRLPTYPEWSFAATRGNRTEWPWGDEEPTPERANLEWGATAEVAEVDGYAFGAPDDIHHLIGNVWEWTATPWDLEMNSPSMEVWSEQPAAPAAKHLTLAGGGFLTSVSFLEPIQAGVGTRYSDTGFRCVEGGLP